MKQKQAFIVRSVSCRLCRASIANIDYTGTYTGTMLCDRCWELDRRIKDSPEIAARILAEILDESHQDRSK